MDISTTDTKPSSYDVILNVLEYLNEKLGFLSADRLYGIYLIDDGYKRVSIVLSIIQDR